MCVHVCVCVGGGGREGSAQLVSFGYAIYTAYIVSLQCRKLNDSLLDQRGGTLLESERILLNRQLRDCGMEEVTVAQTVAVGHRLLLDSELYYCSRYSRVKSRNSYTVKYSNGSGYAYGQIVLCVGAELLVCFYCEVSSTSSVMSTSLSNGTQCS